MIKKFNSFQNRRAHHVKRFVSFCIIVTVLLLAPPVNTGALGVKKFSDSEIALLTGELSNEGFNRADLRRLFYRRKFRKIPDMVRLNVTKPVILTHDRYGHFLESYAIKKAERFSGKWRTTLRRASERFGVDKEVISAILLVETSYGKFLGNHLLLSVFASVYVDSVRLLNNPQAAGTGGNARMTEKLKRKKKWAFSELVILLKLWQQARVDIFTLKGSYAGAFGLAQFLPSSYLRWGFDSDGNGSVNLFLEPDAIYSVANYLQVHGYKKGLDRRENRKAIWNYNHSDVYVDTVLGVARRLRSS